MAEETTHIRVEEPMPPSNDPPAIDILTRQVESLNKQLHTLMNERDEVRASLETLAKERDELKAREATSPERAASRVKAEARIAELEEVIRGRVHYDTFAELAKEAGAKPAAIETLWKISNYKPESDEINTDAMAKVIEELQDRADFAFDVKPEAKPHETVTTRSGLQFRSVPTAPAGGRSQRHTGKDGTWITPEQRASPAFMLNPENQQLIQDAAKEHRFT